MERARCPGGILAVMGIEAAKGPTHGRARTDHSASMSIVTRGRARRWTASMTRSWLSWTNGARVACVNCRNQLPTVRAVGRRAKPQKRAIRGSPAI